MARFWKAVQWVTEAMKTVGAACLVAMTFLTCADVVGRFFGHPIFGSVEIVAFMAAASVAMALPYTHQVRGHIGVEIVFRLLPERIRRILEAFTNALALILFALVTWRMTLYAGTMKSSGEVSMNLELPVYLIIALVAFSFFVFTLMILQDIVQSLKNTDDA
ncbi:MAG: TRAP transporter small permease [Deltaproteobacteria bacterium]|nr:TRAP transporter small permease [Deltaproteobacteria bacterium]